MYIANFHELSPLELAISDIGFYQYTTMATTPTVLIAGANRGIGLQFVKTFTKRGWNVVGTFRPQTRSDDSVKDVRSLN